MGEDRLEACQKEAGEVTEIMLENYTKVLDREVKLTELDERADELRNQSAAFSKTAKTVAQKKRWENTKCKLILAGVVVAALLVIILAIVLAFLLPGSAAAGDAAASSSAGGN
nr:vesicle-associated membrane protein 5 [Anolis sagrei ordinatus]